MSETKKTIPIDRIVLWNENPRHAAVDQESDAIQRLCSSENIEQLARDIYRYGVNPAERLIVFPLNEDEKIDDETVYVVAEGNRRVCALKLLIDPDLAPASIRSRIERYSAEWTPIETIDAVVIEDEERRRHWLLRIHDGAQGGRGRMAWKSEQKTRYTGSGRNAVGQALLDYAEKVQILSPENRSGKISHLARLIGNPILKDALGLVTDYGPEDLHRNRPRSDFELILSQIIDETDKKRLGSQAKRDEINSFAHQLNKTPGIADERLTQSEPLSIDGNGCEGELEEDDVDDESDPEAAPKKPRKPKPPARASNLRHNQEIADQLEQVGSEKLKELYWSVCSINAQTYTPLVSVGVWSFLECLASISGSADNVSFKDYWNKGKISQMNVAKGNAAKTINDALVRLSKGGNTTKHHATSAHFDSRQLINDWETVEVLVSRAVGDLI